MGFRKKMGWEMGLALTAWSRFQFPEHWVMKNVLFPKVITIFKLIYLFCFKMEQTLPGFGVTRFTSASASARFPGVVRVVSCASTVLAETIS